MNRFCPATLADWQAVSETNPIAIAMAVARGQISKVIDRQQKVGVFFGPAGVVDMLTDQAKEALSKAGKRYISVRPQTLNELLEAFQLAGGNKTLLIDDPVGKVLQSDAMLSVLGQAVDPSQPGGRRIGNGKRAKTITLRVSIIIISQVDPRSIPEKVLPSFNHLCRLQLPIEIPNFTILKWEYLVHQVLFGNLLIREATLEAIDAAEFALTVMTDQLFALREVHPSVLVTLARFWKDYPDHRGRVDLISHPAIASLFRNTPDSVTSPRQTAWGAILRHRLSANARPAQLLLPAPIVRRRTLRSAAVSA